MPERVKVGTGSIFDTFNMLDTIGLTLGAGSYMWPFLEQFNGALTPVQTYSPNGLSLAVANATPTDEAAARALETEFSPVRHVGGICSYYFGGPTPNNHLALADAAGFSFGNGTVDVPFSMGIWLKTDSLATAQSLIAKYGSTANLEEYDFRIAATTGLPTLELHDASASTTETAVAATAVVVNRWTHVAVTYDGNEAAPVIKFYVNGALASNSPYDSTESGAYVAMEDTAAIPIIGGRDATASVAQEFTGRLALPFIAAKELSAGDVAKIYKISRALLGVG